MKTRRGNCLVLSHTGYALAVYNNVKFSRSYDVKSPWDTGWLSSGGSLSLTVVSCLYRFFSVTGCCAPVCGSHLLITTQQVVRR